MQGHERIEELERQISIMEDMVDKIYSRISALSEDEAKRRLEAVKELNEDIKELHKEQRKIMRRMEAV